MGIRNPLALAGIGALTAALAVLAGAQPVAPTARATPGADDAPVIDGRGFVHSAARCAVGQTAVAAGRTRRAQVVICTGGAADYTYLGVRTDDDAELQLNASPTGDGFVAHTAGASYTVMPNELVVVSGGKVIYRDTWIEYVRPGRPTAG